MSKGRPTVALAIVPHELALERDMTERLVDDINRIWQRSAVNTLVAVGQLIVATYYGGDITRWRNREANRGLRRLETHSRLPFARKTIYLALHFFDLSLRFSRQNFLQQLGVGHVRVVLGLPTEAQEALLSAAHENGWTIAELTRHASEVRRRSRRRSGRPPADPETQLARRIRLHVSELEKLLSDALLLEQSSREQAVRMLTALTEVKKQVAAWQEPAQTQ